MLRLKMSSSLVEQVEEYNMTVEEHLDSVDYSFEGYIPSSEALLFVNFIKEVNDGSEENETPIVHLKLMDSVFTDDPMVAIMVARGMGKQELGSNKILTPEGWLSMRELKVGDYVVSRTGKPTKITYKTPPQYSDNYEVVFSDDTKIVFGADHNHIVVNSRGNEKVLTTEEMYDSGIEHNIKTRTSTKQPKHNYKYKVPICEPIMFEHKDLSIPPYTMGYGIAKDLRSRTKYIPKDYLFGSITQRLALLRGLMDGDGTISPNGSVTYSTFSDLLCEDIVHLVQSLGGFAAYKKYGDEYVVRVKMKMNPFKLSRKADKWKPARYKTKTITSIKPYKTDEEAYCISVDCSTSSYITKGFTVTHNTTLFAEYLILFIAAFGYMPGFGPVSLMMYVTDSIDNGVRNLRRNVEFRYDNSEFLQKLIPNQRISLVTEDGGSYTLEEQSDAVKAGVKFTDVRLELRNYKGDLLVVKGYGATTGVRGVKEQGQRPTLAILDDLMSDDAARSDTIKNSIKDIIYKAVDKALHPTKRKIIYLGTPFNASDPLYEAVESGAWKVSVFPICERFPVESIDDFKGAWEDRFTYDAIRKQHEVATKVGRLSAFYQEMMLRINSEEETLVDPGTIRQVYYADVMEKRDKCRIYITTDFATSNKESSDFSCMCVWLHDDKDHLTIIDGYCKKSRMQANIDALFAFVEKYDPDLVGIEVAGQQGGFIDWIQTEMRARGLYFALAKQKGKEHLHEFGIRPNRNKMLRLERIVPMFNVGRISICKEVVSSAYGRELFTELKLATSRAIMSQHDDAIDAMTQLMDINFIKPSEVIDVDISERKQGLFGRIDLLEEKPSSFRNSYIV
jgi:hypothetical protein